jgi:hypothetical protein
MADLRVQQWIFPDPIGMKPPPDFMPPRQFGNFRAPSLLRALFLCGFEYSEARRSKGSGVCPSGQTMGDTWSYSRP